MRPSVSGTIQLIPRILLEIDPRADAASGLMIRDLTMLCSLQMLEIKAVTITVSLALAGARDRTTGIRVVVPVDHEAFYLRISQHKWNKRGLNKEGEEYRIIFMASVLYRK